MTSSVRCPKPTSTPKSAWRSRRRLFSSRNETRGSRSRRGGINLRIKEKTHEITTYDEARGAKVEIEAAGSDMLRSLTLSPSQGVAVPLRDATDAFSKWNQTFPATGQNGISEPLFAGLGAPGCR
jgi:hypothetical protein